MFEIILREDEEEVQLGLDVGSSGWELDLKRARARSALVPFMFRRYLFLPRWLAIPNLFLLPSIGRWDHGNGV